MSSLKSREYHSILFTPGHPPAAATTSSPTSPPRRAPRPARLALLSSILSALVMMQLVSPTHGKAPNLLLALLIDSPPAPHWEAYNFATHQIQVGWTAIPNARMYNLFWVKPDGTTSGPI